MSTDAPTSFPSGEIPSSEVSLVMTSLTHLQMQDLVHKQVHRNLHAITSYSTRTQNQRDALVEYVAGHLPSSSKESKMSKMSFFTAAAADPVIVLPLYELVGHVDLYSTAAIAYIEGFIPAAAALGRVLYANINKMDYYFAKKTCSLLADVHRRQGHTLEAALVDSRSESLIQSIMGQSDVEKSELPPRRTSSEEFAELAVPFEMPRGGRKGFWGRLLRFACISTCVAEDEQ